MMQISSLFLNEAGRLRSGWRSAIFVAAYVALLIFFVTLGRIVYVFEELAHIGSARYLEEMFFRVCLVLPALLAGWACNYWLEGLPWRALGLTPHQGWSRDLLLGSIIGTLSLVVAVLVAVALKGLHLSISANLAWLPVARAIGGLALLFFVAALAEEAAYRGYPLQTLTRAKLITLAIVLTSVPFALIHWNNPGATIVSTLNTALAGIWLGVAYLKTRSLWFPLGIHWSWNLVQGPVFGLAVSGLNLTSHTVLHATDKGPEWLTGGRYGIEGGAACSIALLLSTGFILWTRLISPTPELKQMTSEENPVRPDVRQT